MNWVDLFLAIVMFLAIWMGYRRGFINGILDLFCWTGSLLAGYLFYKYTANGITHVMDIGVWLQPVAFLLTTIMARILFGILAKYIARLAPPQAQQHGINKFFGIIPGAINGLLYAIILSALLLALPLKDAITKETRNSRYAEKLAMRSEWANRRLAPVFDEAIQQTMNSLTIHPSSGETVTLPFTYNKAKERPSLEVAMLQMVNNERTKNGLPPLKADPEMTQVARAHSRDMFVKGYFSHYNPEGQDPFDRMRQAHLSFLAAGENLALAQTLEIAHNNLMNSPGHRANILSPQFGRLGIGILDGGYYGLMISQEFRN